MCSLAITTLQTVCYLAITTLQTVCSLAITTLQTVCSLASLNSGSTGFFIGHGHAPQMVDYGHLEDRVKTATHAHKTLEIAHP